jgi:hypothetical protein
MYNFPMATFRIINTRLWEDSYIVELSPVEKVVFLYLITNPHLTMCGIYELHYRVCSFETGVDLGEIKRIFEKFEHDNKIKYVNGWVAIRNFLKYQNIKSPNVRKGIDKGFANAPEELIEWLKNNNIIQQIEKGDSTVYRPYTDHPRNETIPEKESRKEKVEIRKEKVESRNKKPPSTVSTSSEEEKGEQEDKDLEEVNSYFKSLFPSLGFDDDMQKSIKRTLREFGKEHFKKAMTVCKARNQAGLGYIIAILRSERDQGYKWQALLGKKEYSYSECGNCKVAGSDERVHFPKAWLGRLKQEGALKQLENGKHEFVFVPDYVKEITFISE